MLNDPDTDQLNGNHYHEGMDIHDGLEGIDDGLGHHNRGAGSEEGDLADEESDDMLDDDLMDKISSSPSIDDGKDFSSKTLGLRDSLILLQYLFGPSFLYMLNGLLLALTYS